jgi:amino acid adenylation domain-containing protein/FkbH-like protein
VLGAFAHQDAPFERVVEAVRPGRSLSHAPLFQVFFNMLNLPWQELELPGLSAEVEEAGETGSKFDLTLYVHEQGAGFDCTLVYDPDLFDEARMVELSEQFTHLLAQVSEEPAGRIDGFSLVTTSASRLLPDPRAELNADCGESLPARLAAQARRVPERPAVVDGAEVWTFGELERRSNQLAHHLRGGGIGPGDVVAVYGHRSASLVWAVLGVLKAGAAFVVLDPAYPSARLLKYLDIARPVGWLQLEAAGAPPEELAEFVARATWRRSLELPRLAEADGRGTLAGESPDAPALVAAPDALAYVAFTSGSTGEPKGVAGTLPPLAHFLGWYERTFGLSEDDRFSMASGLGHDPLLRDIFTPLWLGATLCVPEQEEEAGLPRRLAAWMRRERVTVAHLVPAMAQLLAADAEHDSAPLFDLRYVCLSGDVLTTRLAARLQALAPSATCVNFYGATETPQAMSYSVVPRAEEVGSSSRKAVPLGRGIDDAQLLLLNAAGLLCGVGEPGEICIRTPFLARGYLGDEALTAERFVVNPFTGEPADRVYRTGDLGRYLPDGQVEFMGRADRQVKVRGFRVEPGEVEAALARCPGVGRAVVVGREDEAGEGLLAAYVVAAGGAQPAAGELRARLRETLPDYMVPAVFVPLEELPLTPNGKVNLDALPALEGDAARSAAARNYVAPRTATEEILAETLAGLLGVVRVGVRDDFFELGGHSLLAVRFVLRVQESLGVEVPLRWLFERPTVAGLAELIEGQLGAGQESRLPPIRPVARGGELPLSFAQERLWVLDRLSPGNAFFNIHQAFSLRGRLNQDAFERSLNEVVARHEALRTTIRTRDGRPFQAVSPTLRLSVPVFNLAGWPEEERAAEVRRLADEEAGHVFDLTKWPLLRVSLVRLGEEEHVVLLTMHHIIADGWSVGLLIAEVSALYEAFAAGRPSPLPALAVQYADYAAWQREWLDAEVLRPRLDYWRQKLSGAPPRIELPLDRPRPAARTMRGARRAVTLDPALVEALRAVSRGEGATLFITMLAALKIALFKWTGQRDLVVGTVTANRGQLETERLVGCFVNFAALRTEVGGDEPAGEVLRRVRASVLEMYAHQDVPFERVVEAVNPGRAANQNPLYNVAFLLQNFPRTYAFGEGLEAGVVETEHRTALLDLRVVAEEYDDGVQVWCEYDTDIFDAPTVERFTDAYLDALRTLAERPATPVAEFAAPAGVEADARRAPEAEPSPLTIAVAASFTAEPVRDALDFWMRQLDVPARYEFAPYNQVVQQLLDPSSLLGRNRGGVNVVLVRFEDWGRYAPADGEGERRPAAPAELERNVRELLAALGAASARASSPLLVCVCPASPGAAEADAGAGLFESMERLLAAGVEGLPGVYLVTTAEMSETYPVANYYDAESDRLGHVPYTPGYFTALGTMIARKIRALRAAPYKVVVLDCDDTLWGGVCGEDGAAGVVLDEGRRALQEFIVGQHDRGMLVCLCSRNNEADVAEVFGGRTEMPLRNEHIAASRINWEQKSENLKSLAAELRLGLDSFIFIDNDPVVCLEVQTNCPEVLTLQLPPEPEKIPRFLKHIWAFDRLGVTPEDERRATHYRQDSRREELRESSLSLADFLAAIELRVRISEPRPEQLARVAQLTQRTNQFNCTTVRRGEDEVRRLRAGERFECLVAEVGDRFGDYGLVGVMIYAEGGRALEVDTLLLSCRALGRGVEHRMLARLGEVALGRGLAAVEVPFRPSGRNQPALDFLTQVGEQFRRPHGEGGWLFSFPADYAAALTAGAAPAPAEAADRLAVTTPEE